MALLKHSGPNLLYNGLSLRFPEPLKLIEGDPSTIREIASAVFKIVEVFHKQDVPFNIVMRHNIVHIVPRK